MFFFVCSIFSTCCFLCREDGFVETYANNADQDSKQTARQIWTQIILRLGCSHWKSLLPDVAGCACVTRVSVAYAQMLMVKASHIMPEAKLS